MSDAKLEDLEKDLKKIEQALGGSAAVKTAEVKDKSRTNGNVTNSEIIQWLKEDNRDFFSLGNYEPEFFDFVRNLIEEEIIALLDKKGNATAVTAKVLRQAMIQYMKKVRERIEQQSTASGGSPSPLTQKYIEYKSKRGMSTDVGIATRQLLDNFSNYGAIRLKR